MSKKQLKITTQVTAFLILPFININNLFTIINYRAV